VADKVSSGPLFRITLAKGALQIGVDDRLIASFAMSAD
jgi:hypothetical protein